MKKCPFCAEEIQDEARLCRYCGRDLSGNEMVGTSAAALLQERLERIISTYSSYRYRIVSQYGGTVVMERGGVVDTWLIVGLVLLLWPAAIIYGIVASAKKFRVELSTHPNGQVSEMGDTYREVERAMQKAGTARTIVWIITGLIFVFACLAGAFGGN